VKTFGAALLFAGIVFASLSAVGEECYDASAQGAITASGFLLASLSDDSVPDAANCLRLVLDHPICIKGKTPQENHTVAALCVVKMPASAGITSGSVMAGGALKALPPGKYCEDVGIDLHLVGPSASGKEFDRKNSYPVVQRGIGALGYGQPDRTIWDIAAWNHPVKETLANYKFVIERVETFENGTFSVFYVRGPWAIDYLRKQYNAYSVKMAEDIFSANYSWAYELVDADGRRYQFNAVEKRMGWGFVDLIP